MAESFILALDQGTTSSRALVVGQDGRIRGVGQVPLTQHFPRPGWVEHDLEEIWESTQTAIARALSAAGVSIGDAAAIGITNQRETIALWDRATSEPAGNAIVWQDRRTAGICEELQQKGAAPPFTQKTGLRLDPYFSGTKLTWMFRNDASLRRRARDGELAAGTMDSRLIWKLTGARAHVTDFTNASRTLLFDIDALRWDEGLARKLEVSSDILPTALPSRANFGVTDADLLGAEIPILGVAGDQQSAVFGHALSRKGEAKNTYGTGCFLLVHAGDKRAHSSTGMLGTLGAGSSTASAEYLLEGSVFVAGAAIQWLRDELEIIGSAAEVEALAASVEDTGGVAFVPAFTGLGAPDWDPHARGAIMGLTRGTEKAHIARAALEAIALSSSELLTAMEMDLGTAITSVRVDGGASENDLLMQMQADFAGVPVERPRETETTALGAAYLAGIELGIWANADEVASLNPTVRTFLPEMRDDERSEKLGLWRGAVKRTLGWAQEA
jgi:glycerol kinase